MTDSPTASAERREHRRIPLATRLQIIHAGDFLRGPEARDISEGGIRLDGLTLPTSAQLKVLITFPGDQSASMHLYNGEIVWNDETVAGVRFTDMPTKSRRQLRKHIRHA